MNKNVQRVVALAVLVIFALSIVPAAFAERDGEEREDRRENSGEGSVENSGEDLETEGEDGAERTRRLRIKDKDIDQARERMEEIREQLQEKKKQYQEAREALREKKEQLSELKEKARCQEESADCQSKKLDLKKGVREHLIKTIELIDRSLEKLQNRVDNSKVLSGEEREDALQKIAELETQLEERKAELEALADGMTNEELRTQIRELKDLWHTVRKEQRWIVAQLTNAKQDNLVGIYVRYGNRAEAQMAKLAEQGAETASLEELLAKYNTKVEELKVAQSAAKAAWLEAKSSPEAMEQAKKLQDAFKAKAKEAKTVLRELLKKIKEVQQLVEETEEPETEDAPEEASEQPTAASAETTVTTETAAESTASVTAE